MELLGWFSHELHWDLDGDLKKNVATVYTEIWVTMYTRGPTAPL